MDTINNDLKYIMISGTGRSGTNITKKIFSKHSGVASLPFEYRFIIDPGGIIDFYTSYSAIWSPYYADIKIKSLEKFLLKLAKKKLIETCIGSLLKLIDQNGKKISPPSYLGWELNKWIPDYDILVKIFISDLKTFEYNGCWPGTKNYSFKNKIYFSENIQKHELARIINKFLVTCIQNILLKTGKKYFIEDNTWTFLFANEFYELLPSSKLIHIYRDPRDVIASYLKQRWSPNELIQAIHWYKSIITKWIQVKNNLPQNYFLDIKFESLVLNPEKELKKMCEFSEIPFENSMLNVKLDRPNISRWKHEFDSDSIQLIEKETSDLIRMFDYSL